MRDGWTRTTLGEIASLTIGKTPPRKEARYWTDSLERPFCTIADMGDHFVMPVREGVTEAAETEGKAKRFTAGTLMMSFKLTIGRVGYAGCDLFPNEAIVGIAVHDRDVVIDDYLALWLSSQDLTAQAGRAVKGNTLNSSSLSAIVVELPDRAEQRRIADLIGAVDRNAAALRSELDGLHRLRSGLVGDLLSGRTPLDESYQAETAS